MFINFKKELKTLLKWSSGKRDKNWQITKDESGSIFIDRDPKHSRLILNFMRDGHVDFQKYSEDVEETQKEAQFYFLDGLEKVCISKTKLHKSSSLVDSDDEIVRVIRDSKKNAVLVVLHNSNPKEISEQVAEAAMICGDKIDVCFNSCKERQGWLYMFHNKTTNKVSRATQLCYVSTTIENFINNIDQLRFLIF